MALDPVDRITGLTSDVDTGAVSKVDFRAYEKEFGVPRFNTAQEVRDCHLDNRWMIYIGSDRYVKNTESVAVDDGARYVVDADGLVWERVEVAINWLGDWDDATEYRRNDGVAHLGSSYVSIVEGVNLNNEPVASASSAQWQLVAERGEPGEDGDDTPDIYVTFDAPEWVHRSMVDGVMRLARVHLDFRLGRYWINGEEKDEADIMLFEAAGARLMRSPSTGHWSSVATNVLRRNSLGAWSEGSSSNDVLFSRRLDVQRVITTGGITGTFTDGEVLRFNGSMANTAFFAGVSGSSIAIAGIVGSISGAILGMTSGATASVTGSSNVWVRSQCDVTRSGAGADGTANTACRIEATGASAKLTQTLVHATDDRLVHGYFKRVGTLADDVIFFVDDSDRSDAPDIGPELETASWKHCISDIQNQSNSEIGLRLVGSADVILADYLGCEPDAKTTSPIVTTFAAASRVGEGLADPGNFGGYVSSLSSFCFRVKWASWSIRGSGTSVTFSVDNTSAGGRIIANWRATPLTPQDPPHDGNMGVTTDTSTTDAAGSDPELYFDHPALACTFNSATDIITTLTPHGVELAGEVVFSNVGGALPTGITAGTTYYGIPIAGSTTTFQIATSENNAAAGTEVDFSTNGTGTHSFVATSINQIKMVRNPVGETSTKIHCMGFSFDRVTTDPGPSSEGVVRVAGDGSEGREVVRDSVDIPDNVAFMTYGCAPLAPGSYGSNANGVIQEIIVMDGNKTTAEVSEWVQ